jgi:hypothetical protein
MTRGARAQAYVIIRHHTSSYVSIRQHTSAYVSTRQHTSADDRWKKLEELDTTRAHAHESVAAVMSLDTTRAHAQVTIVRDFSYD